MSIELNANGFTLRQKTGASWITATRKQLNDIVRFDIEHAITNLLNDGQFKANINYILPACFLYKKAYVPFVRSAINKLSKKLAVSTNGEVVTYTNRKTARNIDDIVDVLATLKTALDEIDQQTKRPELSDTKKLERQSKAFNTKLLTLTSDQIQSISSTLKERDADELATILKVLGTLTDEATIRLATARMTQMNKTAKA